MSESVDRLKELLFEPEGRALSDLRQRIDDLSLQEKQERLALLARIDQLFDRAGTEERFRDSVAVVLDAALREAEVSKHDQMARALAPLVVKTIKTELKNSQDEMVEALYPITGRLVKAYVASAMKDMMDQMNRRIEGNAVMLRMRSLTSGRSVAELALADSQRLEVDEMFLVRRGSGELIERWPERRQPVEGDIQLSGVLTAINEFASHAFKDGGGNLRAFELDTFTVFLRGSPTLLLAAKCRGTAPPKVEALIDQEFLEVIERRNWQLEQASLNGAAEGNGHDGAEAIAAVLPPVATALDAKLAEEHARITGSIERSNPLKAIAAVVLIPLLGWLAWSYYGRYMTNQAFEAAQRIVLATPAMLGYPATLDVTAQGRLVTISGLVPARNVKEQLVERLKQELPEATVVDRLAVVAGAGNEAGPELARVRREMAGLGADMQAASLRRALEQARRRVVATGADLILIDPLLGDDATRSSARRARSETARADREIATVLATLTAGAAASPRPLLDIARQLGAATREVEGLTGAPPAGPARPVGAADLGSAAEELDAASERLHTATVAALFALRNKPRPAVIERTPRERLEALLRANAVFFANGTDYRAPATTERKLDQLAAAIRQSDVVVRVIGYTDEAGGQARNSPLSTSRAEKVATALADRGVPRRRLVIVGRPTGLDLSNAVGPQSANRRVEFELGFDGELDEAQ